MSALPKVPVLHESSLESCGVLLALLHSMTSVQMADLKAFVSPQCRSLEGIQPLPCKDYSADLPFAFAWSLLLPNLLLPVLHLEGEPS